MSLFSKTNNNGNVGKTKNGKTYQLVNIESVSRCMKRGFFPLGDSIYIDTYIYQIAKIDLYVALIPELNKISEALIPDIVSTLKDIYIQSGSLPGQQLQNMATWIIAWALEMVWHWVNNIMDKISFSQDMSKFQVPMDKFKLIPQDWSNDVVNAFMVWCYNNPGYTDRHGIDIFDPIHDGYLAIVWSVFTKVLPQI